MSRLQSILCLMATLCLTATMLLSSPCDAQQTLQVSPEAIALQRAVQQSIAHCEKSIVAIRGSKSAPISRLIIPPDRLAQARGGEFVEGHAEFAGEFGTGVILDAGGLVLTHFDVVRDADSLEVTTAEKRSYAARIVGSDERSGLAVLRIDASGLPAVKLDDATEVSKGQFVVALGNPYGIAVDGQVSASFGIISNIGRKSTIAPRQEKTTLGDLGWLLQTDAKLNLGTSGGALVNLRGEMVGLVTAVAATAGYDAAAGYAIPVDDAFRRIITSLREGKEVEYGLLGVMLDRFGDRTSELGLQPRGALIRDVLAGAPGERAGLRPGDVITRLDDLDIFTTDQLMLEVSKRKPADMVRLTYLRGQRERQAIVQLSKAVPKGQRVVTATSRNWRGVRVDFATAVAEFTEAAREGRIDERGCVGVRYVEKHSPAWNAGLRSGMFISHVGRRRTILPEDFYQFAQQANGDVTLHVTLPRDQSRQITVEQRS